MRNRLPALYVTLATLSLPAVAADNTRERADVPVMGYSFGEQSRALRAILGVPGAARWSDPLPLPEGLATLRIAPGHRWALVSLESGEAGILLLDTLSFKRIAGAPSFDSVEFSPGGQAMVLRMSTVERAVVYSGMPDSPVAASEFAASSSARVAVSDRADVAVASDGVLMRRGGSDFLSDCADDCRFGFFPGSGAIAVLSLGRLSEFASDGSARLIAEGVDEASALLASETEIALAAASRIRTIDRSTGVQIAAEDVPSAIVCLDRMRQSGAMLLSNEESNAVWMFSREGIRFVPARSAPPPASTEPAPEVKEQ